VSSEIEWEFWTAARPDLNALRVPQTAKSAASSDRYVDRETELVPGIFVIRAPGW